jgi:putative transposase
MRCQSALFVPRLRKSGLPRALFSQLFKSNVENLRMSRPRTIFPGRCYLLTRRCSERRFFMRPDPETNNAFVYCLAIAASRHNIDVVGFGMMANHAHVVVNDTEGQLPLFLQLFHRLFACHQNALRERTESFWAANQPTSVVELLDNQTAIEKLVYAITNPVKDHLVDQVHHWPGPNALAAIINDLPLKATRPKRFFSEKNTLPPETSLRLKLPVSCTNVSREDFVTLVSRRVEDVVNEVREHRIASGIRVLGRSQVLAQHWNASPESVAQRKKLKPQFAGADPAQRKRAINEYRNWLDAYYVARDEWRTGKHDTCFPLGVWWLKHFAGVKCEANSSNA